VGDGGVTGSEKKNGEEERSKRKEGNKRNQFAQNREKAPRSSVAVRVLDERRRNDLWRREGD